MAFALTWKVEFGDCTGLTDITSYVMSLNITSDASVGKMGRASTSISINNMGGQFTPGGTGTYASVDWFTQALVVTATSGVNTGTSFVGLITQVDNSDVSAKEAYFVIEALDQSSVAGRSTAAQLGGIVMTNTDVIQVLLGGTGTVGFGGNVFDNRMASNTNAKSRFLFDRIEGNNTGVNFQQNETYYGAYAVPFFVGDAINNVTFASAVGAMYATGFTRTLSLWQWLYDFQYVGSRSTRANTFIFKGDGTALTSGELPFDNAHIGFQTDTLITNAIVKAAEVNNFTANSKYGTRVVQYSNPGNADATHNTVTANNWVNRYSSVRYLPDSISVDYSSLRGSAVDDGVAMLQFMYLLWPAYSLWNRFAITVKGAGQSSATTYQVISTKTIINATPSDTSVTVSLVSNADNSSFILDSSVNGVLNQDHIG
jgi:hypothetical protein